VATATLEKTTAVGVAKKARSAKWNPAHHPRDARGRFTKSATRVLKATDAKAARSAMSGFKPVDLGPASSSGGDWLHKQAAAAAAADDAVKQYFAGGWKTTNNALRTKKDAASEPDVIAMDKAMKPLSDDVMLERRVSAKMFAHIPVEQLEGMKVRDAAYQPTALQGSQGEAPDGMVTIHMATPAGTRAVINPDTGGIVLDRDTETAISRVEPNGRGGYDLYGVVIPKQGAQKPGRPAGEPGQTDKVDDPNAPDVTGGDQGAPNDTAGGEGSAPGAAAGGKDAPGGSAAAGRTSTAPKAASGDQGAGDDTVPDLSPGAKPGARISKADAAKVMHGDKGEPAKKSTAGTRTPARRRPASPDNRPAGEDDDLHGANAAADHHARAAAAIAAADHEQATGRQAPRTVEDLERNDHVRVAGEVAGGKRETHTGYVSTPRQASEGKSMLIVSEWPDGNGKRTALSVDSTAPVTPVAHPAHPNVVLWKDRDTGRPVPHPTQPEIVRHQTVRDTDREQKVRDRIDELAGDSPTARTGGRRDDTAAPDTSADTRPAPDAETTPAPAGEPAQTPAAPAAAAAPDVTPADAPEGADADQGTPAPAAPVMGQAPAGFVPREKRAQYRKDYLRGWKASSSGNTEGKLEAADARNEVIPWYHGWEDYSLDDPKFTEARARDAEEIDQANGDRPYLLRTLNAAGEDAARPQTLPGLASLNVQLAGKKPGFKIADEHQVGETDARGTADAHGYTYVWGPSDGAGGILPPAGDETPAPAAPDAGAPGAPDAPGAPAPAPAPAPVPEVTPGAAALEGMTPVDRAHLANRVEDSGPGIFQSPLNGGSHSDVGRYVAEAGDSKALTDKYGTGAVWAAAEQHARANPDVLTRSPEQVKARQAERAQLADGHASAAAAAAKAGDYGKARDELAAGELVDPTHRQNFRSWDDMRDLVDKAEAKTAAAPAAPAAPAAARFSAEAARPQRARLMWNTPDSVIPMVDGQRSDGRKLLFFGTGTSPKPNGVPVTYDISGRPNPRGKGGHVTLRGTDGDDTLMRLDVGDRAWFAPHPGDDRASTAGTNAPDVAGDAATAATAAAVRGSYADHGSPTEGTYFGSGPNAERDGIPVKLQPMPGEASAVKVVNADTGDEIRQISRGKPFWLATGEQREQPQLAWMPGPDGTFRPDGTPADKGEQAGGVPDAKEIDAMMHALAVGEGQLPAGKRMRAQIAKKGWADENGHLTPDGYAAARRGAPERYYRNTVENPDQGRIKGGPVPLRPAGSLDAPDPGEPLAVPGERGAPAAPGPDNLDPDTWKVKQWRGQWYTDQGRDSTGKRMYVAGPFRTKAEAQQNITDVKTQRGATADRKALVAQRFDEIKPTELKPGDVYLYGDSNTGMPHDRATPRRVTKVNDLGNGAAMVYDDDPNGMGHLLHTGSTPVYRYKTKPVVLNGDDEGNITGVDDMRDDTEKADAHGLLPDATRDALLASPKSTISGQYGNPGDDMETLTYPRALSAPKVHSVHEVNGRRVAVVQYAQVHQDHRDAKPELRHGDQFFAVPADSEFKPITRTFLAKDDQYGRKKGDAYVGSTHSTARLDTDQRDSHYASAKTPAAALSAARAQLDKRDARARYEPVAQRNVGTHHPEDFQKLDPNAEIKPGDLVMVHAFNKWRTGVAYQVTGTKVHSFVATPSGGLSSVSNTSTKGTGARLIRARDDAGAILPSRDPQAPALNGGLNPAQVTQANMGRIFARQQGLELGDDDTSVRMLSARVGKRRLEVYDDRGEPVGTMSEDSGGWQLQGAAEAGDGYVRQFGQGVAQLKQAGPYRGPSTADTAAPDLPTPGTGNPAARSVARDADPFALTAQPDDGVDQAFDAAAAPTPAPIPAGVFNDAPLTPNDWGTDNGGPVDFHKDGEIGSAVNRLGADARLDVDGKPLAEQLNLLATAGQRGDITTAQQIADLKTLRDRLPEGPGKKAIASAVESLDVPDSPVPAVPDTAPAPARRLMAELHANPLVRSDGKETGRLADILDRHSQGKLSGRRMIDEIRQSVLNNRHESKEGKSEIDRSARRAMDDLEAMRLRDRDSLKPANARAAFAASTPSAPAVDSSQNVPPAPAAASVDDRVQAAVTDALGGQSGGLLSLAKLRDQLADVPRADVDAALLRLDRARAIQLEPDPHRLALTDRAKAAAIPLGGEDMHLVTLPYRPPAEDVPAAPATPNRHDLLRRSVTDDRDASPTSYVAMLRRTAANGDPDAIAELQARGETPPPVTGSLDAPSAPSLDSPTVPSTAGPSTPAGNRHEALAQAMTDSRNSSPTSFWAANQRALAAGDPDAIDPAKIQPDDQVRVTGQNATVLANLGDRLQVRFPNNKVQTVATADVRSHTPAVRETDLFGGTKAYVPGSRADIGLSERSDVGRTRGQAAVQQLGMFDTSDQRQMDGQTALVDSLMNMPQAELPTSGPGAVDTLPAGAPEPARLNLPDDISHFSDEQLAEAFAQATAVTGDDEVDNDAVGKVMAEWERREGEMNAVLARVPADLAPLADDDVMKLYADVTAHHGTMDTETVARLEDDLDRRDREYQAQLADVAAKRELIARDPASYADEDELGRAADAAAALDDPDAIERIFGEWGRREEAEREAADTARVAQQAEEHATAVRAAQQATADTAAATTAARVEHQEAANLTLHDQLEAQAERDMAEDSAHRLVDQGDAQAGEEFRNNTPSLDGDPAIMDEFYGKTDAEVKSLHYGGFFSTGDKKELSNRAGIEHKRREALALARENHAEAAKRRRRMLTAPIGDLSDDDLSAFPALLDTLPAGVDRDRVRAVRVPEVLAEADRRQNDRDRTEAALAAGPAGPAKVANPLAALSNLETSASAGSSDAYNNPDWVHARARLNTAKAHVYGLKSLTPTGNELAKAQREDPRDPAQQAAEVLAWYRHLGKFDPKVTDDSPGWIKGVDDENFAPPVEPLPVEKFANADKVLARMRTQAAEDHAAGDPAGRNRYIRAGARMYRIPFDDSDTSDQARRDLADKVRAAERADVRTEKQRSAQMITEWRRLAEEDGVDPFDSVRYGPSAQGTGKSRAGQGRKSDPVQEAQINALVAGGTDWLDAYAQVHNLDADKLRKQDVDAQVKAAAPSAKSLSDAYRAQYGVMITEAHDRAEEATRGHLLNEEGQKLALAGKLSTIDLFSGSYARAMKYASEELRRWWGEHPPPRMTFEQWRKTVQGDPSGLAAARQAEKGNEFA
jgi:hypothetical protein